MNLLVDSGNSFIKWALSDAGQMTVQQRLEWSSSPILAESWSGYRRPGRVLVANVNDDQAVQKITEASLACWQLEPEFLASSRHFHGLVNSYRQPAQLGVDRLLAMLAAMRRARSAVIVIDCGTAVTVDLVDADGAFVGGVIMPGLHTARRALRRATAAIDQVVDNDYTATALSTEQGVASGTLLGLAGAIERVVSEQAALCDSPPVVFLTGGDADDILMQLNFDVELRPHLVLEGLHACALDG